MRRVAARKKSLASLGAIVLYMFAVMIPAPFIDKFAAFLVWLAERIAEIRERNALRALAALDQAGDDQPQTDQPQTDQAGLDPTRGGALLADCTLSPRGSALSSAPESCPPNPLPSGPDSESFPHLPAALAPAAPAPAAAAIVAPATAAAPPPRHQDRADESIAAPPVTATLLTTDRRPGPIPRPLGRSLRPDRARSYRSRGGRDKRPIRLHGCARPKLSDGMQIRA
jgi:hypothetical protein